MAVIKPYTTEALLETFLGITIPSGDADLAINSAVQVIDNTTGRNFIAETSASIRLYDGSNARELMIDDCIEITLVERGLDEFGDFFETIPSSGLLRYYTRPINAEAKGLPFTSLILRSHYWFKGIENQRITAKWGYSEDVPPAIQEAATILASGMYMYNLGGASGAVTSEKIGNYAVTYDSDAGWRAYKNALQIIQQFTRYYL
jgi:hypothetical protein